LRERIAMTAMPQLVAAFHSLVGHGRRAVAAAAFYSPRRSHIGMPGAIYLQSLVEMSLGVAIGAVRSPAR
jgi:NAD(P) transhydrogenase subunit beta